MIHIVQCLCPLRHCMMAAAYQPTAERTAAHMEDELRRQIGDMIAAGIVKGRCAICGSEKLTYETGVTRFASMEEALPELRRLEAEQARARFVLQNRN